MTFLNNVCMISMKFHTYFFMKKIAKKTAGVCGTAVIGTRGQLVVPKEIRDRLKLRVGDRFLMMEHFGRVIMLPEKMMRTMMNEMTKFLK